MCNLFSASAYLNDVKAAGSVAKPQNIHNQLKRMRHLGAVDHPQRLHVHVCSQPGGKGPDMGCTTIKLAGKGRTYRQQRHGWTDRQTDRCINPLSSLQSSFQMRAEFS